MADQGDVRRIASSLPETVEADDTFAFSVRNGSDQKGFVWVWHERVEPTTGSRRCWFGSRRSMATSWSS